MIVGIGLSPQLNTQNISKRDLRAKFGSPVDAHILKIDQDRENSNNLNLFVFRKKRLFERATQSLEKLYTALIRKGFIYFSKKESGYYLAQAFRKLIEGKLNTKIYQGLDINYDDDLQLERLRQESKKKNNILGKISRKRDDNSVVSFTTQKGYRGILERITGRQILEGQQVHHIDHDHNNNRQENLYLTANQDHHTNLHEQLRRLGTILIRKGFINFSRQNGIYRPSKILDRLLRLKKDSPVYKRAAERRTEEALQITPLRLSEVLTKAV